MAPLPLLDLFSGVGGFSLGLERSGFAKTVAFCEKAPNARKILSAHWPGIPVYDDIKELSENVLRRQQIKAEIITGGFPCQPFSSAARGRNNAEDLWPEMARLAVEIKPSFAIAENVQFDPIARAADHFTALGMSCDVLHIPAYEIGADTERSRWWVVAHPYLHGQFYRAFNAEAQRLPEIRGSLWGAENYRRAICLSDGFPARLGASLFGNAVVPIIPEMIGRALVRAGSR